MTIKQQTLNQAFSLEGVGLHQGKKVKVTIAPAPEDHGIIFKRIDLSEAPLIPAHRDFVELSELSTSLVKDGFKVQTIEHLMAALYAKGIDNALISVNSQEIPILDGSAKVYFDRISETGKVLQNKNRRVYHVKEPSTINVGDRKISFEPHMEESLIIDYTTHYPDNEFIGKQQLIFELSEENFSNIASARTFCLREDVEFMQSRGLALGGSLDNAIVVDGNKVLNPEGLRFEKELVKHKIIDCIGDLSLLGARLHGKVTVYKGGHSLHHELSKKLL